LVDDQLLQSEIKQNIEKMAVDESYTLVVTGSLIS
jgi:hypothetical protein